MRAELPILYSDDDILAVDKPSGILSIPDRYDPDAPVAQAMLRKDWGRLFVVHRLDRDTTGLLVYARNEEAHRALNDSFATGEVRKIYLALASGAPDWEESSCDLPLRADGDRDHRTIVDASHGKSALTRFFLKAKYRDCFQVEARPETGRTHQVRVHLAALGHPCLCDPLYGDGQPMLLSKFKRRWKGDPRDERPLVARTALHALSAEFAHPRSREAMRIEAPLPRDLRAALSQLGKL